MCFSRYVANAIDQIHVGLRHGSSFPMIVHFHISQEAVEGRL
jgi:hypothetical protein